MAGGMNAPRNRPSMAERLQASAPAVAPAPAPASRHCWVSGLADHPGRWPGLLLEWRKVTASVWQGRVVYAVDDGRQTILIEEWLSGVCLEPAG
jgi:hypothetical protein